MGGAPAGESALFWGPFFFRGMSWPRHWVSVSFMCKMLLRTPVLPTQGILGLHVCESLLKTAIDFLNEQSSVQHGGAVDSVPGQLWASG